MTPALPLELSKVKPELGSRALFPNLKSDAYLAHAAISPASLPVTLAVSECLFCVSELGVGSYMLYAEQRERLRAKLGQLLSVDPKSVTLSAGTTRGITDVALALPLKASDEIVTFDGEFPANVVPYQLAANAVGARVTLLPRPNPLDSDVVGTVVAGVNERLKAGARYVAVSAVQFQTGLRMPLKELSELCESFDAHLLVDAIQAVGAAPLDLSEIRVSALFGGAHKWLLGLEGAGYAYHSERLVELLNPTTAGWLSVEDAEGFLFRGPSLLRYDRPLRKEASVFEGSTASSLGFVAMEAGVDVVSAVGPAAIEGHLSGYHDQVEPILVREGFTSLRARASGQRSGILSFQVPDGVKRQALSRELAQRGIVVSSPDGYLRLAPHFSNSLSESELFEEHFAVAVALARAAV